MDRKWILFFLLGLLFATGFVAYAPWKKSSLQSQAESVITSTPLQPGAEKSTPEPLTPAAPIEPDLRQNYCAKPHSTTCNTNWPSVDPTGTVRPDYTGEIRALRFMRNLIHKNPDWTSEQVQNELAQIIYTPERRAQAENVYQWVRAALTQWIEEKPESIFSRQEKDALLNRLSKLTLELPPPANVYSDAVDLITKNTVYFERTPKGILRLRMGGAYLLNTTSWFNMTYTLSHEMAHVIDPCEAKQARIEPRAYENLISCFVNEGWVEKERSTCGPNEQISEVFADWVAAEILGQALIEKGHEFSGKEKAQAAINSGRDLCEQVGGDSLNLSVHQKPEVRIGSLIGKNPTLRKAVGCTQKSQSYCQFQ